MQHIVRTLGIYHLNCHWSKWLFKIAWCHNTGYLLSMVFDIILRSKGQQSRLAPWYAPLIIDRRLRDVVWELKTSLDSMTAIGAGYLLIFNFRCGPIKSTWYRPSSMSSPYWTLPSGYVARSAHPRWQSVSVDGLRCSMMWSGTRRVALATNAHRHTHVSTVRSTHTHVSGTTLTIDKKLSWCWQRARRV